ncbi:MAG TPA: hypothetical protein VM285_15345 [Polyangia bacterium]|nr:hypothetical protein [Polyangia bacterium]
MLRTLGMTGGILAFTALSPGCSGGAERLASPAELGIPDSIMDPGEHLLIEPQGAAEGLLGRQVTQRPDGGYEIADSRASGCSVSARRIPSQWTRTYRQDLEDAAGFGASLGRFASLKARYSKGLRLETSVENEMVFEADLRGTCGDLVITSVKVGTGRR